MITTITCSAFNIFRTLKAVYDMNIDQMSKTTQFAKDFIMSLLKVEPESRMKAEECLQHKWLRVGGKRLPHMNSVIELETSFMKKCLARRRWYRAFNTLQVYCAFLTITILIHILYRLCIESED